MQAMKAATAGAPKKDPAARIAKLVQSVILLREALTALPSLAQVLQVAKAELLKAVRPTSVFICLSLQVLMSVIAAAAAAGQICGSSKGQTHPVHYLTILEQYDGCLRPGWLSCMWPAFSLFPHVC